MRRPWHWLTSRVTSRPRRITVLAWSLMWLFSPDINRLIWRYRGPLAHADEWFLLAAIPVGAVLFAWVWWSGRGARKARRERRVTG